MLVLLTRFAVSPDSELKLFAEDRKFKAGIHLTDSWFDHRLRIFEEFCLPSVVKQTDKNFRWCVLVDSQLDQSKKERLLDLLEGAGELIEVFPRETLNDCLRRTFKGLSDSDDSVRLDSDDMIARDFVSTMKRSSGRSDGVNLLHGLEYDLAQKTLKHRFIRSNPFLLLAMEKDISVFSYRNHVEVGLKRDLRNVLTIRPMYCRVIHGRNTAVAREGGLPVLFPRHCAKRFGAPDRGFQVLLRAQVSIFLTRLGQAVFLLAPALGRVLESSKRAIHGWGWDGQKY